MPCCFFQLSSRNRFLHSSSKLAGVSDKESNKFVRINSAVANGKLRKKTVKFPRLNSVRFFYIMNAGLAQR